MMEKILGNFRQSSQQRWYFVLKFDPTINLFHRKNKIYFDFLLDEEEGREKVGIKLTFRINFVSQIYIQCLTRYSDLDKFKSCNPINWISSFAHWTNSNCHNPSPSPKSVSKVKSQILRTWRDSILLCHHQEILNLKFSFKIFFQDCDKVESNSSIFLSIRDNIQHHRQ